MQKLTWLALPQILKKFEISFLYKRQEEREAINKVG